MDPDEVEQKLKELGQEIEKMEQENAELFRSLGVGPHQIEALLNDSANFTKEDFELIQKERKALEEMIDLKIKASRAQVERKAPQKPIGGHWIFVR